MGGGVPRHTAAERPEIGVATAVRWLKARHETGATSAKPKGPDQHAYRIQLFRDVIVAAVAA